MTKKSIEQQLSNRYSITSDIDRKFVKAKILDEIAGKKLANKYRTVQLLASVMVDRTTLKLDDFLQKVAIPRHRSHSIAVAAEIMQY